MPDGSVYYGSLVYYDKEGDQIVEDIETIAEPDR